MTMFFDDLSTIGRTLLVGTIAYAALVVVLRISGKRTLAKMNAFDLVVTVALGSTLATILLDRQVALAEGVAALVTLVALQFSVAWLAVRAAWARRAVKSTPTLLLQQGELLPGALRQQRITEGEVRQAVRSQGIGGLESVAAVVMETDGSLSVVPRSREGSGNALSDVLGG